MKSQLCKLLQENEHWLMNRVLSYAKKHDYTRYTSTLVEAWRLSIQGLTSSFVSVLESHSPPVPLGLKPYEETLTAFGIKEAQLHRKRGVELAMFMGLMKYYRQTYCDLLLENRNLFQDDFEMAKEFIISCFDKIEITFCSEWNVLKEKQLLEELQHNQRMLVNEKNAYLTVFESLEYPVILVSKDGKIVNYNLAAQKFLLSDKSVPGALYYRDHLENFFLGQSESMSGFLFEKFPWLPQTILDFLPNQRTKTLEFFATIESQERYFFANVCNMRDVSEKFTSIIITLNDLTEKKRNLFELEQALALKNKLFRMIAHDLISPFNVLMGMGELLDQRYDQMTDADRKESISFIQNQSKELYNLSNNLLIWSQGQSETLRFQLESKNLFQIAEKTIKVLTLQIQIKGLKVENLMPQTTEALVDLTLIETVFRNLISNAIKFSNRGGFVRLTCSESKGTLTLCVADTGVGMSDGQCRSVFGGSAFGGSAFGGIDTEVARKESMETVAATKKVESQLGTLNEKGTGFGIVLCKDFINKMNGRIWAKSEPNKGTQVFFTVQLP